MVVVAVEGLYKVVVEVEVVRLPINAFLTCIRLMCVSVHCLKIIDHHEIKKYFIVVLT